MMEGRLHRRLPGKRRANAPRFTAEDLRIIASPVDFVGLNVYLPNVYVKAADTAKGYEALPLPASHPRMASPWLTLGPR